MTRALVILAMLAALLLWAVPADAITCTQIRQWHRVYGIAWLERMAVVYGVSLRDRQRARQCIVMRRRAHG